MSFRSPEFSPDDELLTTEVAFIQALALLAGYNANNVQLIGGAGSFTMLPATGAPDGNRVAFTFTQKPTYVVSDGAWYTQTDNNGGAQWSWNTVLSTVTMVIPPNSSIFGVA